ncbi:hypothetical protein MHU86_5067 [Fragilaria crotonensis]|nr:hypothetical protein MHU86_5067 [Fragilaria crotonensis]
MGFVVGMIGAVSGYGIAVMTNAARKIPLSREPWNHAMFSIFGYWAGNYYVKTERRLVKEINEIRADKGLPTLVGTHTYE